VYVSITCTHRAVTALLMRLFSSSDKHSLQKIRSQHLVQINLVVDQAKAEAKAKAKAKAKVKEKVKAKVEEAF